MSPNDTIPESHREVMPSKSEQHTMKDEAKSEGDTAGKNEAVKIKEHYKGRQVKDRTFQSVSIE